MEKEKEGGRREKDGEGEGGRKEKEDKWKE